MLYRSYPRLTQPPLSLQTDELLGAVVERLLKAMREVRPRTVREFFALANQHMRWELNDLARRLDRAGPPPWSCTRGWCRRRPAATPRSTPDARRMLEAIDGLPEDEREAFDLVRHPGADAGRGRRGAGRFDQDGAAAAEPRPGAAGGAAGRPPAGSRRRRTGS